MEYTITVFFTLNFSMGNTKDKIFSKCRPSVIARTLNQDFTVYTNRTVTFFFCPTTDLTEYTPKYYKSYSTPFPICKVAIAIQLMC